MTDTPSYIGLSECVEHEDGSVTYKIHMDDKARDHLCEEGLKLVLYCAAFDVDLGDLYDWIESQGKSVDTAEIRELDSEERQRAIERSKANGL
jgi:hypothetical protein